MYLKHILACHHQVDKTRQSQADEYSHSVSTLLNQEIMEGHRTVSGVIIIHIVVQKSKLSGLPLKISA